MITKKIKIILILIFSILSIVYIICSYYGIPRYLSLKYFSGKNIKQNLLLNYSNLRQADKSRVIISFTTNRINKIQPFLNSLLDQSVKVDQIALNLYKNDFENITIPADYTKFLNIFYTSTNYSNNENIIPTILREGDSETKIIVLQDNYIYGLDYIEEIIDQSDKNPNSIILDEKTKSYLVKPGLITNLDNNLVNIFENINIIKFQPSETYKLF